MLRIVSVSLGSSSRDKRVETTFAGHDVCLERVGADGNLQRAGELIAEHDRTADAIGLGGIDLALQAGSRLYPIRDAQWLAARATRTPVVDGSGLKNSLEQALIDRLAAAGRVDFAGSQALLVSSVDRWGMAVGLATHCRSVVFGDILFALGLPIPLRGLRTVERLARVLLPVLCRLPFRLLYPTGEEQRKQTPKHGGWFAAARIIAGDWHFIRRFMPADMRGKVVLTNTTTDEDVAMLRERGADLLVTTTPRFEGRSFGTNVIEAMLTAVAGRREPLPAAELLAMLDAVGWEPGIERLTDEIAPTEAVRA